MQTWQSGFEFTGRGVYTSVYMAGPDWNPDHRRTPRMARRFVRPHEGHPRTLVNDVVMKNAAGISSSFIQNCQILAPTDVSMLIVGRWRDIPLL
jgi:hypothetical protein